MLVLGRKVGQTIKIGDDITVVVQGQRGDIHLIGVDAPKEVEVHRQEVYERIQREKSAAREAEELNQLLEEIPAEVKQRFGDWFHGLNSTATALQQNEESVALLAFAAGYEEASHQP